MTTLKAEVFNGTAREMIIKVVNILHVSPAIDGFDFGYPGYETGARPEKGSPCWFEVTWPDGSQESWYCDIADFDGDADQATMALCQAMVEAIGGRFVELAGPESETKTWTDHVHNFDELFEALMRHVLQHALVFPHAEEDFYTWEVIDSRSHETQAYCLETPELMRKERPGITDDEIRAEAESQAIDAMIEMLRWLCQVPIITSAP